MSSDTRPDVRAFYRLDTAPGLRSAASRKEAAKVAVGLLTLVPLRLASMCVVLSLLVTGGKLAMLLLPRRHLPGALSWMIRAVSRALLFILGFLPGSIHVSHEGRPTTAQETPLVVANHISYIEILHFLSTPMCPSFILKAKVLSLPFIGVVARDFLACIAVQGNTTAALAERVEAISSGLQPRRLLVFPEGTTSNGSALLRFRSGAFVPGAAVLPVVLQFPFDTFSPSWEAIYPSVHLVRLLSQPVNRMRVQYLEPYTPSEAERADAALFAAGVRRTMAEALNVPQVDAGYREKMVFHSALRRRLSRQRLRWVSNLWVTNPLEGDFVQ